MFPPVPFRPSDYPGNIGIDIEVRLERDRISASAKSAFGTVSAEIACSLEAAKNPEKTLEGVRKAFSKLGGTAYRPGEISLSDPDRLFAPMSVLNDLRRDLAEKLDSVRESRRNSRIEAALADAADAPQAALALPAKRRIKIRAGMKVPAGDWDEIVVSLFPGEEYDPSCSSDARIALPVYTKEPEFNRLRVMVKGLVRRGCLKWEASDLATLRMLKSLGVSDITADWSLYAFNASALKELSELGVKRFVASPENGRDNLQYLAESGFDVEFIAQQSTPLFISLTAPADEAKDLAVYGRGGLWITVRPVPRTFTVPEGASERIDLSWDLD
jgi:putative protease